MSTASNEVAKHGPPRGQPVNEQWVDGNFVGRRWIRTAWGDRYAKIDELGSMNGGAGELWPYNTNTGGYLHAARIVGSGRATFDGSGLAVYGAALIELRYSTMAPIVYNNKYVISETIEPWKQHMSFPANAYGLRWDEITGDPISGWLSHVDCRMVYVLSFHNILNAPVAALGYIGCCNQQAIPTLSLGVTFAKETLLHSDPFIHRSIRPGYLPRYTLRYRWPFHPQGWNKKWNPKTGAWSDVYHPTTGQIFFHPTVNFFNLYP